MGGGGEQHHADRLEPVKLPEAQKLEMSDDNVLKILNDCEAKLERLMEVAMEEVEDGDHAADVDERKVCV